MKLNQYQLITAGLLALTACSSLALTSTHIYADDTVMDTTNITVPESCSMTGTVNTAHTATLNPGTWSGDSGSQFENGIGKTTLTTFCNDNNGFSIYAIGYTDDTYGTTTLKGNNTNIEIPTKVYASGDTTSNWSMKVTKVENPQSGDPVTYNPDNMTISNSFSSWHVVPSDYTRVAEYHAQSGSSTTDQALGAKVETTYAAYISQTQPADTYTGQVKYVMVHPYSQSEATDPQKPSMPDPLPTPPTSCNNPITGITYMQEINSANKSAILASLTEEAPYYIYDSRDNEPYCVSMLKDGNLWMLDNLRLDLTNSDTLANVTELTTNASSTTLGYLKGTTTGTASDQYATSAVSDWTANQTFSSSGSYSDPLVAASGNCEYSTACANDPESGKWTKDSLPPGDNNGHLGHYGNGSGKIGVYYNFCAASAGSYCYGDTTSGDYGSPSGDATEDICPKNWRMPSNDEFETLGQEYSFAYGVDDDIQRAFNNKFSSTSSGGFANGSAHHGFGHGGLLWSSSFDEGTFNMFDMETYGSGGYVGYPEYGYSLRCVPR